MDSRVQDRMDEGIRSLENELASEDMPVKAYDNQRIEFETWLVGAGSITYGDAARALVAFDAAALSAVERYVTGRDGRG